MSYATAQEWLNGAKEMAERELGRRQDRQETSGGQAAEKGCHAPLLAGCGGAADVRCGGIVSGQIIRCLSCEARSIVSGFTAATAVSMPMPEPIASEADKGRSEQLATLRDRRRVYIEYARHRIDDEDWHGVSDAANDLRELDVEIRMLEDRR